MVGSVPISIVNPGIFSLLTKDLFEHKEKDNDGVEKQDGTGVEKRLHLLFMSGWGPNWRCATAYVRVVIGERLDRVVVGVRDESFPHPFLNLQICAEMKTEANRKSGWE